MDFETTLSGSKHVVNYSISQYMDGKEFIHTSINEFCTWLFKYCHKGYTVIAHNGKGYDCQFILEWLVSKKITPNIINTGDKIMYMEVKQEFNIRFIDSLSFIQMKLKDFPATFNIEGVKGYFPYKFNIPENYNYIGKYPSPLYYGTETMTKKDRLEFIEWCKTVKNGTFNFQEQMYKYCKAEVDILRKSCILFRELFIKVVNIDPFQYIIYGLFICLSMVNIDVCRTDSNCRLY